MSRTRIPAWSAYPFPPSRFSSLLSKTFPAISVLPPTRPLPIFPQTPYSSKPRILTHLPPPLINSHSYYRTQSSISSSRKSSWTPSWFFGSDLIVSSFFLLNTSLRLNFHPSLQFLFTSPLGWEGLEGGNCGALGLSSELARRNLVIGE